METTALFTDLSAEEAETVNGAHYYRGGYYYYSFAGYAPVYVRRYRRYRRHRYHYRYSSYRPRYYSSYRTVSYSSCW